MNDAGLRTLDEIPKDGRAVVRRIDGGSQFASRLAAMGIVVGASLTVLQNTRRGPMLVSVLDTRLALGRGEAQKIRVGLSPPT